MINLCAAWCLLLCSNPSVEPPFAVSKTNPIFSSPQHEGDLYGRIVLACTVTAEGQVENPELLRDLAEGDAAIGQTILQELLHWTFAPGKIKGQPRAMSHVLVVEFGLDQYRQVQLDSAQYDHYKHGWAPMVWVKKSYMAQAAEKAYKQVQIQVWLDNQSQITDWKVLPPASGRGNPQGAEHASEDIALALNHYRFETAFVGPRNLASQVTLTILTLQ